MRIRMLGRFAMVALIGATAAACEDMAAPITAAPPAEAVAPPALSDVQAGRVRVALEDALTRLLPHAGGEASPLAMSLKDLAATLATGDVHMLNRRIDVTRQALEASAMEGADSDALALALALVGQAVTDAAAAQTD